MWIFTDIADWLSEKQKRTDQILDNWVEDSKYDQKIMIVAATTHAITTFGTGFGDLLRAGDGIKQGTLKGVGEDALRFVAIIPWGRVATMVRTANGVKAAALIVDTGGPICSWVASAKALAQIKHSFNGKIFASVEDLAKAVGVPIDQIGGIFLKDMLSKLRSIGAKVGQIKKTTSEEFQKKLFSLKGDDLKKLIEDQIKASLLTINLMLRFDGKIILISVHVMKEGKFLGNHTIYAFRDAFGRLRFMDRTVASEKDIYLTMEAIAPKYRADKLIPFEIVALENVYAKFIDGVTKLAMPIRAAIGQEKP